MGLIPGWGTKTPHAAQWGLNLKIIFLNNNYKVTFQVSRGKMGYSTDGVKIVGKLLGKIKLYL